MRHHTKMPSIGSLFLVLCNYLIMLIYRGQRMGSGLQIRPEPCSSCRWQKAGRLLYHSGNSPKKTRLGERVHVQSSQDGKKRERVAWSYATSMSQIPSQLWVQEEATHILLTTHTSSLQLESQSTGCHHQCVKNHGPWSQRMMLQDTEVLIKLLMPMAAQVKFFQDPMKWNLEFNLKI